MTDKNRRRKHVSKLQDRKAWRERKELPPADATWPTCLIIAPSTVVHNWEREFKTVRLDIVSNLSFFLTEVIVGLFRSRYVQWVPNGT